MSIQSRTTKSLDGVRIVYSVSGSADTALLFIHGGLADRTFWEGQHAAFSDRFTVVAPDLAGHGESGRDRQNWAIPQFAHDVTAVMDAEKLTQAIVVGNSLGGSVALEAALIAGDRVLGVIGVDTFHDLGRQLDPGWAREQADAWRRDFAGTLDRMLRALFHPDAQTSVVADVRQRMSKASGESMAAIFLASAGYDTGTPARQLHVPVRCINGDLFPTNIPAIRDVVRDFDAIVIPHTGHYPMLERPDEFNRVLANLATAIQQGRES